MAGSPHRILVYDGDCMMCTRLSRLVGWRWLVGKVERRPYDHFHGEDAARLALAGVHNELAVLDGAGGEIRVGYDGIRWLLEGGRLPWLAKALSLGPLRWLLRHDYRLVAYNRRIFSPPRRASTCACDPDVHLGYRWTFIALALLWTGLLAALSSLTFQGGSALIDSMLARGTGGMGPAWVGAMVLAGWAATAPFALRLPASRRIDYLGHTAWVFAAMVVPLLVALLVAWGGLGLSVLLEPSPLSNTWLRNPGVSRWLGIVSWGLALPIAVLALVLRLPPLGMQSSRAVGVALLAWILPTLLMIASRSEYG